MTLLLLTHDRQAYADDPLAAVASALMRAGPTMAVFTSGLFALVLRLRTRGQVEHENLTREYLDNMDSLRQKARDGDPFAIQTHVSYVMGFAERHGSRRREAIDVVCTYLRPAAQAGLPEPPVSYLRQRLVQHLRRRFAHLPPAGGAADWLYAGKLGPRGYWPGAVLDLRAARLEDLQLDCCRIAEVNLRDAQLSGATSFCRCVVERLASFAGAQFLHDADFGLVHLRRGASFDRATFFALADFTGGRFGAATTFRGVHFNGEVRFSPGAANVDLTDAFVRTATVAQGRLRLPSGWGVDMDRPVGGCYPIVHSAGRIPEQRPAASEERAA